MKMEHILIELESELSRAKEKHPVWSFDPVHGAAILAEETGSVLKAALDFYYGRGGSHKLKTELVHALAMAARFLLNFELSESWTEAFKKGREEALEKQEKYKQEIKNGRKL